MKNTELRAITPPSGELQPTTQTLRATKYSIKSTYSDLPCYLKVARGKLPLINRPWKCKKGKDRRLPLVHSRNLAEPALFPAVTVTVVRDRKIRTALRTNQIAGFVTVPSWKKIITNIHEPEANNCFSIITQVIIEIPKQ